MRYTDNGTIFYSPTERGSFAVQICSHFAYGGAPFKTIKWATWENGHYPLGLQETNENPEMYGWKVVTLAELVLFADKEVIENIKAIKRLIELGYKGNHFTKEAVLSDIQRLYG